MFYRLQKVHKIHQGKPETQFKGGAPKVYTVNRSDNGVVTLYNNPDVILSPSGNVISAPNLLKSNWAESYIEAVS